MYRVGISSTPTANFGGRHIEGREMVCCFVPKMVRNMKKLKVQQEQRHQDRGPGRPWRVSVYPHSLRLI